MNVVLEGSTGPEIEGEGGGGGGQRREERGSEVRKVDGRNRRAKGKEGKEQGTE